MEWPKRSVWLHFSKQTEDIAKCNKCGKLICCKGGCTSNMSKHLNQHDINLQQRSVFDVLWAPSPSATDPSLASAKTLLVCACTSLAHPLLSHETPFSLPVSREKTEECRIAGTTFLSKGLHPFTIAGSFVTIISVDKVKNRDKKSF